MSLLDLAHALRNWADMKVTIGDIAPKFNVTIAFKSARPAKKTLRAASHVEHVFAYMPDGVLTFASNGDLSSSSRSFDKFTVSMSIKRNPEGSLELKNYCFIGADIGEVARKTLPLAEMSRGNFSQWMGAEAVRVGYFEANSLLRKGISREVLIRRVANTMGGSHPAGGETVSEFDQPIKNLMQTKVAGVPLPYFILLKSAQDIVQIAPRLLPPLNSSA